MFRRRKYKDNFGREYDLVHIDLPKKNYGLKKVYALLLTYSGEDYLPYCEKALKGKVDGIFKHSEKGDDLSAIANKCLDRIPKNSWVFYVNPDEILFDLPENYLRSLASYLETQKIYCTDVRFRDFAYNYGTLFAQFDWGEGVGNYWTARRFFKWTGKEKFIHKTHFNISNTQHYEHKDIRVFVPNHEHTGEWEGSVAKLNDVILFHYGKCRGMESQRGKGERLLNGEFFIRGQIATIPYRGRHPSVMNLD
jgi:hypothetical protein